jgi:hypothetical protein
LTDHDTPPTRGAIERRGFLGAGAAALMGLASFGAVKNLTPAEAAEMDHAAMSLKRPRFRPTDPVDRYEFPTPQPQPGGQVREYWIQAESHRWNIAPHRKDEWLGQVFHGRRTFRAYVYREYEPGFARPKGPARIPGPYLQAEVGDVLRVHFRNGDRHFRQAVTMHPHGVSYNPEYDAAYYGPYTRAGGFVAPGEEFTYTWECPADSAGVWPYHDHGPNCMLNKARGLIGVTLIRPKGEPLPDREFAFYFGMLPPAVTGRPDNVMTINARWAAGNTPTLRTKVGDDVAVHVIGGDDNFHTLHFHGHRWSRFGQFADCTTVGPFETLSVRWTEDNPGRWLYHCHVDTHMMHGMAGWYIVDR